MKSRITLILLTISALFLGSCEQSSDEIQSDRQEAVLRTAVSKIAMPALPNLREMHMMINILEKRDQALATWTYMWSDYNRCYTFIGASVAYPIPYATEFTSPMKVSSNSNGRVAIPQADPNGLYPPASAEGTFLELGDPSKTNETGVMYSEPRLTTVPFELPERLICPPLVKPPLEFKVDSKDKPKVAPKREPAD